jgi:hypothetical protein
MLISLSEWLGCWSAGITMRFKVASQDCLSIKSAFFDL